MYQQKTVKAFQTGGLYLIATPIGNMKDMTYRAIEILQMVDYVLAEDTRVTRKLLQHYQIDKPIESCHEHNQFDKVTEIIADIQQGKTIALVSDAGMPCISDPGAVIVAELIKVGLPFTILPGASAGVSLYTISGMSQSSSFIFHGFLPTKQKAKENILQTYSEQSLPVIFYESPHRIEKTLQLLPRIFTPTTKICIARELTKLHESLTWLTVDEISELNLAELDTWKGEIALIIEPSIEEVVLGDAQLVDMLRALVDQGMKPKEAMKIVASQTGVNKNSLYDLWENRK